MPGALAVGTRIAPRPPRRSRRALLNAPGSCLGSNVIGLRGIGYPCSSDPWARCFSDMPVPALCPGHASQLTLPSTGRLPSTVSAADVTRHCSRLHRYYAAVRLLICVHAHRSAVAFMGRSGRAARTRMRSPKFRRKDVTTCTWGLRLREAPRPQAICAGRMLLSGQRTASAPRNSTRFAAQYPARGHPCERFELALAGSPRITRGRRGWLGPTP